MVMSVPMQLQPKPRKLQLYDAIKVIAAHSPTLTHTHTHTYTHTHTHTHTRTIILSLTLQVHCSLPPRFPNYLQLNLTH